MKKQLKMLVGVALVATLALAGTLGMFAFAEAQPVQAQANPTGTRSVSPGTVAQGGTVTVTISTSDTGGFAKVTEMLPAGFTYSGTSSTNIRVDSSNTRAPVFTLSGTSFTYRVAVAADAAETSHRITGTLRAGNPAKNVEIAASTVTVRASGGDNGGTTMPVDLMVDALPRDPGAAAQITVKFPINHGLNIDESIVLEVGDDLGVPSSIAAGNVSIHAGEDTASPRSVVVETNSPEDRFKITLFIGDMSDKDGAQNLDALGGDVTVTFRQEAGSSPTAPRAVTTTGTTAPAVRTR